jgi:hypothetical protein
MERKVRKIHLDCTKCHNPLTVLSLGGNAIGELFSECICVVCAREVTLQIDLRVVSERAAHDDAQNMMANLYSTN